jgi:hypothetical protein
MAPLVVQEAANHLASCTQALVAIALHIRDDLDVVLCSLDPGQQRVRNCTGPTLAPQLEAVFPSGSRTVQDGC